MDKFSLINFLGVSIPEQFMMVFFAWIVLGRTKKTGFHKVMFAGIAAAILFQGITFVFDSEVALKSIFQAVVLILIIYVFYKPSFIEATLGALLTTVIVGLIQWSVVYIEYFMIGMLYTDLKPNALKVLLSIPEYMIIGLVAGFLYTKGVKLFDFEKKKINMYFFNKISYMVLQMIFTFLIILTNYRMFMFEEGKLKTNVDKALLVINFIIIVVFSILIIKSAFKMSEKIQKEEQMKRLLDNKELVQNLEYLCKLMELKEYEEVHVILKSIKEEVDGGLINNISSERRNSTNMKSEEMYL